MKESAGKKKGNSITRHGNRYLARILSEAAVGAARTNTFLGERFGASPNEGRFLGGRPPYGYWLAEAGPHPNPAKAADGKRLHRLETDPVTAPVVQRIFAEYLGGRGIFAIAEALTRDDVASPSAYDPGRNRHRPGVAWSKGAIRVILSNPRYTGRQVWNKQRKDEILIDVEDIALGHETRMRWNDRDQWVFSDHLVHDPIIDTDTFERAQQVLAAKGAGRGTRERHRTHHTYMFRGRLRCGLCQRRMQGQRSRDMLLYRCRYPNEYALANKVVHPRNVYLAERDLLGPLDDWLSTCFAEIRCLIKELGDIRHVLSGADPLDKAEVYQHLNLQMTYHPAKRLVRVETSLDPHSWGYSTCPEGNTRANHRDRPAYAVIISCLSANYSGAPWKVPRRRRHHECRGCPHIREHAEQVTRTLAQWLSGTLGGAAFADSPGSMS